MSAGPSPFVWYELMTTDPAAAKAFYSQVVGWTAADSGMPDMEYTLLSAGSHQIAGLMALPPEACATGVPPNWTGYVAVADVDAKAADMQAAGGQVLHPPHDIPGVGRFAVMADPQGAVICLFKDSSNTAYTPPPADMAGTVGWHELIAADGAAAWDFYSQMFGWTKAEAMDMGPMGVYQLFAAGSHPIGGMMTKPPEVPVPCWLYYFNTDAIDAAIGRVTAGGGKVIHGPMEVPGGSWIVQCTDPQGAVFALVAPKR